MAKNTSILCIGSVLWDLVGRTGAPMAHGNDVPGRIERLPGGVALNIAMTLKRFDLAPELVSVIGTDAAGDELLAACEAMGLGCGYLLRDAQLPTDAYMAIEDVNGLVAAMCDAHSLEAAGDRILAPLLDGRLGDRHRPYEGVIALDGNLTEDLLAQVAELPEFRRADLRIAPASPGKATRLTPLLAHPGATLYVNLEEAGLLLKAQFTTAWEAASALIGAGATRAVVTDGPRSAALGDFAGTISAIPPDVPQKRVTGAGDTFMAAHIAAEMGGAEPQAALEQAVQAAARYVSGEEAA